MEENEEHLVSCGEIPLVSHPVSRIFYGTSTKPLMKGENSDDLLDAVFGMGICAFDLARHYEKAEEVFGSWMERRGNRKDLVLLSKGGHPGLLGNKRITEKDIRKDFEQSAASLHTDYIDIYLLHRDDLSRPAGEAVEILNALHAEGKIGAFGGSNWTVRRIEEANEYAYKKGLLPFAVSSPNFGLADQVRDPWGNGCVTISGPSRAGDQDWYRKNQMPVIAYSSLGRGFFSGKLKSDERDGAGKVLDGAARRGYVSDENFERLHRCEILARKKGCSVPQIALAWIFTQGLNVYAVVSTTSPGRMEENIKALQIPLSEQEARYLNLQDD